MSTPVATVADALFAFIMSLLRDPDAAEQFAAAPHTALANHGLGEACTAADVRSVKPVIVDHPHVTLRSVQPGHPQQYPPGTQFDNDPDPQDEVIREITRIVNQFTSIDARSTIVDQSTNQNIWTEGGDVTQIFDQDAVVASGDDAVAAGDDATIVDSDVDITVGDVSVGNTANDGSFNTDNSNNGTIDGSFNGSDPDDMDADEALDSAEPGDDALAGDEPAEDVSDAAIVAGDAVTTAVDAATDAAGAAVAAPVQEAPVEQPADLLSTDLTQTDVTYESDAASAVVEEPLLDEPAEEQ